MPASARRSVYRMDRYCLAAVAVMHQARDSVAAAVVDRLLERVQHEVRVQQGGDPSSQGMSHPRKPDRFST
jgi:hypothetical protein